ncbi:hypothetical protein [Singulisphaera acidiphila]|uniref:Lipoprotein n=1 Tax=Singulisphaera acidiphila (strain ATCC BAA-1392 / DSM 18658 / VKM B-2454 / MOB10) TaxID=886293 RepID=L0D9U9_SINAD|nr:hypothetical protein [Singulisphaera acidiphila]AGA25396.1 hypothetical protein Sinac_0994 [Singulisphaera acidiphila DSM 18658]
MKRFLALSMILGVTSFGLVGCGEEPKVEEPAKVEAPADAPKVDAPADAPKVDAPAEAPAVPPADAPK